MRYRDISDLSDISRDAALVIDFIGEDEYRRSFAAIHRSLNAKGFVTPYDDAAFALELDLFNLENLRTSNGGTFQFHPQFHAGMDFLIGVGQTIPHLSTGAKRRLLGRLRKGLKEGLWPLQHEFRIAGFLSKIGWDIYFHDLEEGGGYDFLATRDGVAFEVEAKAMSVYTAWPIKPEEVTKLFVEAKQSFSWNDERAIPILRIKFLSGLSCERTQLRELISAVTEVARTREEVFLPGIKVGSIGTVSDMPGDKLLGAAHMHSLMVRKTVVVNAEHPKFVLELNSNKPVQLAKKMLKTIRETAKERFSHSKPGAIWMHIGMITDNDFNALSSSYNGKAGLLDRISERILLSEKRTHLSQLVFSGGSSLKKTPPTQCTSFASVVYDSPLCLFGSNVIFPGGRQWPGTKEKATRHA